MCCYYGDILAIKQSSKNISLKDPKVLRAIYHGKNGSKNGSSHRVVHWLQSLVEIFNLGAVLVQLFHQDLIFLHKIMHKNILTLNKMVPEEPFLRAVL
jgi:hypothetical protein